MAFNEQQISPIDFNPSIAVGLDIPFNGSAVFKQNFQTQNAIKNNLINFFLTNPGEHYLDPTFGGGLRTFLFEQITDDNTDFLREDIASKISQFFPNIIITSLDVSQDIDFNSLIVDINYQVANTNISDNITLNL